MVATYAGEVAELRRRLSHPVVDGDGHLIESIPTFAGYLERVGGEGAARRVLDAMRADPLTTMGDADRGDQRGAWWGVTNDADDLATVMAPALLAERLDEIGLDFTILYPTIGLALPTMPDDELRRLACRALNTMHAELCAPYADRMTPVAVIPMHTPDEAVAELHHAVEHLGLRAAMIPAGVARPWPAHPDAFPTAQFVDRFGIDSHHDYDPVWAAFSELRVAVTAHGGVGLRYLECGRRSPTSYMFNHVLAHAYQQEELAKSLVMAGVPRRFPTVRFGFLEGGAGWAADLLHALVEHWEKRNAVGLRAYDPAGLDQARLAALVEAHGLRAARGAPTSAERPAWARDEFAAAGIGDESDFADLFDRQLFFGCEADDRSVFRALDGRGNPFGLRLHAMFSSDIGHWDVPALGRVLLESRRLVDDGLLDDDDYRDFVCTNPIRLHAGVNPAFFDGTAVEATAREVLATEPT